MEVPETLPRLKRCLAKLLVKVDEAAKHRNEIVYILLDHVRASWLLVVVVVVVVVVVLLPCLPACLLRVAAVLPTAVAAATSQLPPQSSLPSLLRSCVFVPWMWRVPIVVVVVIVVIVIVVAAAAAAGACVFGCRWRD